MLLKLKRSQKGMTLLEVLISVIVLSFGVLGLAPLMMMSVESNNVSRDVIRATELGKQRMEALEALDSLPTLPYKNADSSMVNGGYYITTYIEDNASDSTIPSGVAYATIQVSWNDNLNQRHSTSFTTMLEKAE